ncbi:MAG: M50 family metallopeptidase [Microgenomates group bacterium]
MLSFFVFLLILSILVVIHEFGHFIAAKKNGVKVEEFGFGIPPRIWGIRFGETLYSLNWLPIGGFVKVLGEEEAQLKGVHLAEKDKNRTFSRKPAHVKLLILTAGVIMNVLLAVTVFYALLGSTNYISDPILLLDDYKFRFGQAQSVTVIAGILEKTPAAKTTLKAGDIVTRVQLQGSNNWFQISDSKSLTTVINSAKETPVIVETEDFYSKDVKTVKVTPFYDEEAKRNIIGVSLVPATSLDYSSSKFLSGIEHSYNLTAYNAHVIGSLIASSFKSRSVEPVSQVVSGPVGIFGYVDQILKNSGKQLVVNVLNLLGVLSLSLALINILPFPALDGGRAAVVLYETITRKAINPEFERKMNMIGFGALLSLLLLITINDIIKLF